MKLSIISLNFRKPDLSVASLESLRKAYSSEFKKKEFEYILVDNHSEDDSFKKISRVVKKQTGFHILENPVNNGFGGGNNFGAKHAKGDYLLFLNNDTEIEGSGIADMLFYLKEHPEASILGGELKNFDGTPQVSVGNFLTLWPTILLLLGTQRINLVQNPKRVMQVDWVKGALLMIKREVFEKLHGFDEGIFMYTEDMELCFRAHEMGYKVFFYPTSGILHKDQGSSNRTFAIVNIYENLLYFYKKHRPDWEYKVVKLLLQTKAIILILYGKLCKKTYFVETYEKALNVVR